MILVDTSAWIEFLRGTRSGPGEAVKELLAEELAICDVISMEVLAGARDDHHLQQLRGLLARATVIDMTPGDYEHAASLHRICRRQGETVRSLADCLIAAVALRASTPVLHNDRDYETLARHTGLLTHPASRS